MKALASGRPGAQLRGLGGSLRFSRLARRRPRPRTIVVAVAVLLLLGGIWLWLRDSPLVSVRRITVSGATGPDARVIRAALTRAGRGMTTLDVNQAQLRAVLAPYPEVKSIEVSTALPHGLRIRVVEQLPVADAVFAGRSEAVTGSGVLLGSRPMSGLPQIALAVPPGGPRVTEASALACLRALAAAPYHWLSRISRVKTEPGHGVVVELRNGPSLYLGGADRLRAKWLAAAAVLADSGSAGATYIDVTDPARPAAGAGTAASSATGQSTTTDTTATLSSAGG